MIQKKTPGPKPRDDTRYIPLTFRVNRMEFNKIKGLAKLYTNGDKSEFIRMRIFDGILKGSKTND